MSEQKQSLNTQLANAVAAVASAQDHLVRMCELTERARRDEAAARTKVNEAQNHFDELVAQVKKSAPRDTNWTPSVDVLGEGAYRSTRRLDAISKVIDGAINCKNK